MLRPILVECGLHHSNVGCCHLKPLFLLSITWNLYWGLLVDIEKVHNVGVSLAVYDHSPWPLANSRVTAQSHGRIFSRIRRQILYIQTSMNICQICSSTAVYGDSISVDSVYCNTPFSHTMYRLIQNPSNPFLRAHVIVLLYTLSVHLQCQNTLGFSN